MAEEKLLVGIYGPSSLADGTESDGEHVRIVIPEPKEVPAADDFVERVRKRLHPRPRYEGVPKQLTVELSVPLRDRWSRYSIHMRDGKGSMTHRDLLEALLDEYLTAEGF